MIGQEIENKPNHPLFGIFCLILGLALIAAFAATQDAPWLFIAGWLLVSGIALVLMRDRPFRFRLTDTAIERDDTGESIPYETIETIRTPGRPGDLDKPGPRYFAIAILHEQGAFRIPGPLSVPADDVFLFLMDRLSPSGSLQVNRQMRDYLAEQLSTFGEEKVYTYRARSRRGEPPPSKGFAFSLGMIFTGVCWAIGGAILGQLVERRDMPEMVWIACGVLMVLFGGLFALATKAAGRQRMTFGIKDWESSSIVISPLGLAMFQGEIKGEMRWEELRNIRYSGKQEGNHFMTHQPARGIRLEFRGGTILYIHDLYDRPLHLIYRQIKDYWKR